MNTKIKDKDKQKPDKKNKDQKKAVAFAYFSGKYFIGWYADTFGSVRDWPKIYRNSDSQLEVIERNFNNKLDKIETSSFDEAKKTTFGLAAIGLAIYDSENKLRGKDIELRVVEVPFYDPEKDDKAWLSLDREQVRVWASKKPNKFLKVIKHKKTKKEK